MPETNNTQHAAMHLHNELQRQRRVGSLTWGEHSSGPGHKATWTCTVYSKI
ncbi:hypothetical protein Clacol_004278 [Clathrus columnatus]|uniref:Uncharacterized protein n=1 Tax=Clathrus columnatus TaxID=1419009 RepID=A0AAV5A621_9AGAM|nr:hypothetical protein Clacol_004278 [Clathrus columnatus]